MHYFQRAFQRQDTTENKLLAEKKKSKKSSANMPEKIFIFYGSQTGKSKVSIPFITRFGISLWSCLVNLHIYWISIPWFHLKGFAESLKADAIEKEIEAEIINMEGFEGEDSLAAMVREYLSLIMMRWN